MDRRKKLQQVTDQYKKLATANQPKKEASPVDHNYTSKTFDDTYGRHALFYPPTDRTGPDTTPPALGRKDVLHLLLDADGNRRGVHPVRKRDDYAGRHWSSDIANLFGEN